MKVKISAKLSTIENKVYTKENEKEIPVGTICKIVAAAGNQIICIKTNQKHFDSLGYLVLYSSENGIKNKGKLTNVGSTSKIEVLSGPEVAMHLGMLAGLINKDS